MDAPKNRASARVVEKGGGYCDYVPSFTGSGVCPRVFFKAPVVLKGLERHIFACPPPTLCRTMFDPFLERSGGFYQALNIYDSRAG